MQWRYSLKELFADKRRAMLTMLAICWGTLAISLMLSAGQGMEESFLQAMRTLGSRVLVVMPGSSSERVAGLPFNTRLVLSAQDVRAIKALPSVQSVLSLDEAVTTVRYHQSHIDGQSVLGVTREYNQLQPISMMPGGRFLNPSDARHHRAVIVLGHSVAHQLFADNHQAIGQYVQVNGMIFQVIGVAQPITQVLNNGTPKNDLVWMPQRVFQVLFQQRAPTRLLVWRKAHANKAQLKQTIRSVLAARHHMNRSDETIIHIIDNQTLIHSIAVFFTAVKFFLGLVGAMTLLVASLGVANVMYAAVTRATADIGVRMACGAKPYDMAKQYLCEALLLALIGGLVGLVLNEVILCVANRLLQHVHLLSMTGLHVTLSLPLFLSVLGVLCVVGALAGFFPARLAAKTNIVEALHSE